jgi:hypothetical protein
MQHEKTRGKCTVSYITAVCAYAYQLAQYFNLLPLLMNYCLSAVLLEYTIHITTVHHADFSGLQGPKRKLYKEHDMPLYHSVFSFHTSTLFTQMQCTLRDCFSLSILDNIQCLV